MKQQIPPQLAQLSRRRFIKLAGAGLFVAGLNAALPLPVWAKTAATGLRRSEANSRYDLNIG